MIDLLAEGFVVDGFGGPGGWSQALRMLSESLHARELGIEWDHAACLTRVAAGHGTVRADVSQFVYDRLIGRVVGVIMSPPCQAWSKAGKGLGLLDQPRIFEHLDVIAAAGEWVDYPRDGWHDPRSPLVLEVVRAILTLRPVWFACEQVPDVLPFWQRVAELARAHGYNAEAFTLSAEEYGVPQTRERAFVIGNSERQVAVPEPTHRAYKKHMPEGNRWGDHKSGMEGLFGDGLQPWISMLDALPELQAGGTIGFPRLNDTESNRSDDAVVIDGTAYRARDFHPVDDRPAPVVTEKTRSWIYRNGNQANAAERELVEPAPTIHFGAAMNDVRWIIRTGGVAGEGRPRPADAPSPTLTGSGAACFVPCDDASQGAQPCDGESAHGAPAWTRERPATTVTTDPRGLPEPKYRKDGERQWNENSVRVTVQQAGILQSFPSDYPWRGSRTAQHRQVGDAVPPLLGLHVLAAATGLPLPSWLEVAA